MSVGSLLIHPPWHSFGESLMTTTSIAGLAAVVPPHRIDRQDAISYAETLSSHDPEQARKLRVLYRRAGVQKRGSVLLEAAPDNSIGQSFYPAATSPKDRGPSTDCRSQRYAAEAPILARAASQAALDRSGVAPDAITHLITITCTGFDAPGIDITLIDDLALPLTTQRVQIGFMGCHGAINGLRTAAGLIAASPQARVLLCSVELCSLHYQYGYDANRIVSGALFADGAGAMILAASGTLSAIADLVTTGSYLVPESRDAMTWRIGNHGYEMTLSAAVPNLLETKLEPFVTGWLADHGESIATIGGWAVHPGGMRILRAVELALSLPADALAVSREVLAEHGNMSSSTMVMVLDRFAAGQVPKPWLMLGFGPGLEIEVALIR